MKLAILSDIHGNLPALTTVLEHVDRWAPDQVIVNGDTVNRGPWPAECLQLILDRCRQSGWRTVRGNHEDYVVSNAGGRRLKSGPLFEIRRNSVWTYEQLGGDVSSLAAMPFRIEFPGPDGRPAVAVHASVHSNRDSIFPDIGDGELIRKMGGTPGLFATAHTHRPFIRRVAGTLAVNSGSVGLPFDGDPRATYAQLTWGQDGWHAELVRLEYDRAAAIRGYAEQGFLAGGGALTRLMQRELELSRALVFAWDREYSQPVLEGDMDIERSVEDFLASLAGRRDSHERI